MYIYIYIYIYIYTEEVQGPALGALVGGQDLPY